MYRHRTLDVFCPVCGLNLHITSLKRKYLVITVFERVMHRGGKKTGILGFLSLPFSDYVAIFISSKIAMRENH